MFYNNSIKETLLGNFSGIYSSEIVKSNPFTLHSLGSLHSALFYTFKFLMGIFYQYIFFRKMRVLLKYSISYFFLFFLNVKMKACFRVTVFLKATIIGHLG